MTQVQEQDEDITVDVGGVEITYYTDPYCSWCWASEPAWLRLRESYGGAATFKTVMGGLVETAAPMFEDEQRIAWLRAHMHDVAARSGQPIDASFLDDMVPSFSTWPACIHVKAAEAQSQDVGLRMLRRLRLAALVENEAASDPNVARRLAQDIEGLDPTVWLGALSDGSALQAFLDDRKTCAERGVRGFPTFMIRAGQSAPRVLMGYRPYPELERALQDVAPGISPRPPRPVVDLLFDHGPLTTREIQEIQGTTPRETIDVLDGLAHEGTVEAVRIAGGTLWRLSESDDSEE